MERDEVHWPSLSGARRHGHESAGAECYAGQIATLIGDVPTRMVDDTAPVAVSITDTVLSPALAT